MAKQMWIWGERSSMEQEEQLPGSHSSPWREGSGHQGIKHKELIDSGMRGGNLLGIYPTDHPGFLKVVSFSAVLHLNAAGPTRSILHSQCSAGPKACLCCHNAALPAWSEAVARLGTEMSGSTQLSREFIWEMQVWAGFLPLGAYAQCCCYRIAEKNKDKRKAGPISFPWRHKLHPWSNVSNGFPL